MKTLGKKGIVISNVTNLILLAIGIILLVVVVITLFPGLQNATKNVGLQIKKPFCCNIMSCTSAVNTATNPSSWAGSFACTAFCAGVCG